MTDARVTPDLVTPERLTLTAADGVRLAALLYRPHAAPAGAVLVVHGAGSRKENHGDFALRAVARGLAVLSFDVRGHGDSEGRADHGVLLDVRAAAAALRAAAAAPWLAVRGSSMGAYLALSVAAEEPRLFRRIAALCPADEAAMMAGFDRHDEMIAAADPDAGGYGLWDAPASRRFYSSRDLAGAAAGLGGVLIVHAGDDESVPFAASERLFTLLGHPKRLVALRRGGHTGIQHDPALQRLSLDWICDES